MPSRRNKKSVSRVRSMKIPEFMRRRNPHSIKRFINQMHSPPSPSPQQQLSIDDLFHEPRDSPVVIMQIESTPSAGTMHLSELRNSPAVVDQMIQRDSQLGRSIINQNPNLTSNQVADVVNRHLIQ